ncbi:MAG: hypothetical protein D6780_00470, partial [Candidatus Dadabacteria bacterium]
MEQNKDEARNTTQREKEAKVVAEGKQRSTREVQFSALLLITGAACVIAAFLTLLVGEWYSISHLKRFLTSALFDVLLLGAASLFSLKLKVRSVSKATFALSVIGLIVLFLQSGAMLYSLTLSPAELQVYPAFLRWQAENFNSWLITAGCLAVLSPLVSFLSFSALLEEKRNDYSWLFILLLTLILVPVRNDIYISLITLGSL